MTNQEKKEKREQFRLGNILIAKFMGWRIDNSFPDKEKVWRSKENHTELDTTFKFHTDWNELMLVMNKIHNTRHKGFVILATISTYGAYIGINPTDCGGNKYEGNLKIADTININYFAVTPEEEIRTIEGVWLAVVDFINWYNEQQNG